MNRKHYTENGQISSWTLGGYRVSVLNRHGLMFRSRNVKVGGFRILTSSRHFAPLMLSRMIGGKPVSPSKDFRLWRGYRPIVLSTSDLVAFVQGWANSMTSRQRATSRRLDDTWLNICSRKTFSRTNGRRVGVAYVTPNLSLSYAERRVMRSYYLRRTIGKN